MIGDANPTLLSVTRDRAWIDAMTAGILIRSGTGCRGPPTARAGPEGPGDPGEGRAPPSSETRRSSSVSTARSRGSTPGPGGPPRRWHRREPALAVATRLADAHHGDLGIQSELAWPTWTSPTSSPRPASLRKRCRGATRRWRSSARWSRPNRPRLPVLPCRRPQAPRDRAPEVRPARRGGLGLPRGHRHPRGVGPPDTRQPLRPRLLPIAALRRRRRCRLRSHGRRRPGRGGPRR